MKRSAFLTNALSRLEIDGVLGPLRLAQRTLQDPCICVVPGSNAQRKSRALEGCRASSKSPSMVKDGDKVAAGWNGKEYSFTDKGLLMCPLGYQ